MKILGSEPINRLHNRKVLQRVLNVHKLLEICKPQSFCHILNVSPAVESTCCIYRFPCDCEPSVTCDSFVPSQSHASSSFLETLTFFALTSVAFRSLCCSVIFSLSYCCNIRAISIPVGVLQALRN